jgi:hypothetical protein
MSEYRKPSKREVKELARRRPEEIEWGGDARPRKIMTELKRVLGSMKRLNGSWDKKKEEGRRVLNNDDHESAYIFIVMIT